VSRAFFPSSLTSNLLKSDTTTNYAPFALDREPGSLTGITPSPRLHRAGQWLQCQTSGSNVRRVLRRVHSHHHLECTGPARTGKGAGYTENGHQLRYSVHAWLPERWGILFFFFITPKPRVE